MKTIFFVGGGTGGHIMPLLALADEISSDKQLRVILVVERGSQFKDILTQHKNLTVKYIFAGKLRRYKGYSFWQHVIDPKVVVGNLIDVFKFAAGLFESLGLFIIYRPKLIFVKGGFVSLPVGLIGALMRITILTHDSDTTPSLTNKIIGRFAKWNLLGFEAEIPAYAKEKCITTGIPIDTKNDTERGSRAIRERLQIPADGKVLLVVGGSSGAQVLNESVMAIYSDLINSYKDLYIIHQTGKSKYKPAIQERVFVLDFLDPMADYIDVSTLVITRAGATAIAEFASAGKPMIVIPHPHLTGGHQLANAAMLERAKAAVIVQQDDKLSENIMQATVSLLDDPKIASSYVQNLKKFDMSNSTKKIAVIIKREIN